MTTKWLKSSMSNFTSHNLPCSFANISLSSKMSDKRKLRCIIWHNVFFSWVHIPQLFLNYSSLIPQLFLIYSSLIPHLFLSYSSIIPHFSYHVLFLRQSYFYKCAPLRLVYIRSTIKLYLCKYAALSLVYIRSTIKLYFRRK